MAKPLVSRTVHVFVHLLINAVYEIRQSVDTADDFANRG